MLLSLTCFVITQKENYPIINDCLENRSGISKTTTALKDGLKKITGSANLTAKLQDLEVAFLFAKRKQE